MAADSDTLDRNADRIVTEIGIAPCPAIVTQLLRETRGDEPDFRRVGQLIGSDVALAASVLAVVNSPFYGLRSKATSVPQALSMLGLDTVTQLVTGLLLRQAFWGFTGEAMEGYWKRSMTTSLICALVSRETRKGDRALASTYGLFRDCGMPVMLRKFPIYADLFEGTGIPPGEPVIEVENERYSTNHARIGLLLARNWQLPASMCLAILRHHDWLYSFDARAQAQPAPLTLVATGLAADELYCGATGSVCAEWEVAGGWAMSQLGLMPEKLDALRKLVRSSLESR